MDNMQPYDDLKRRQQAAAAASYIQSSDENPDEVADNLNFAREYAQRTGNPLPTQQLVKEYRPMFQRLMDETRDKVPLSTARKTATWYGENPMAILLAKDDVYNLCSFEASARSILTPSSPPAASRRNPPQARSRARRPPALRRSQERDFRAQPSPPYP
jgi:hypothetical protein